MDYPKQQNQVESEWVTESYDPKNCEFSHENGRKLRRIEKINRNISSQVVKYCVAFVAQCALMGRHLPATRHLVRSSSTQAPSRALDELVNDGATLVKALVPPELLRSICRLTRSRAAQVMAALDGHRHRHIQGDQTEKVL